MVRGAVVTIKDDLGASHELIERSPGLYRSDSLEFRGVVGRSYTLFIKTKEGTEYESEPARMYEVPLIDSLYFDRDREFVDGIPHEGVNIYSGSKHTVSDQYFRWTYEEWWKFHVPYPMVFKYIDDKTVIQLPPGRLFCWKQNMSNEIIIGSSESEISNWSEKKPVIFIPADRSDRLMIQYYIKIKQFSLSKEEYDFWDQLKQINTAGGDIFDKQPFQISSNILSSVNTEERVLGWFGVSAVSQSSMYITRHQIDSMRFESFDYGCDLLYLDQQSNFPNKPDKPVTLGQLYDIMLEEGYSMIDFIENDANIIYKLVFVRNNCSDCTETGTDRKPDFWIDLN